MSARARARGYERSLRYYADTRDRFINVGLIAGALAGTPE
jgi:hypothetical protein